jgi:Icc-related predicted phosphoesterase
MTRVVVTADFHGRTPPVIPECDLCIIAGDIAPGEFGKLTREALNGWISETKRSAGCDVIAVAGNHDFDPQLLKGLGWWYLEDEAINLRGLKIWGSPWSPTFGNWAFMRDDSGLAAVWEQIPTEVDIIISHGPVFGYGDYVRNSYSRNNGEHVGSVTLRNRLTYTRFPNLKLVACGHIHEGYGSYVCSNQLNTFDIINGAWVDADYEPGQAPIVIDL